MVKKKILAMGLSSVLAISTLMTPNSDTAVAATNDTTTLTPAFFFDFENGYESSGTSQGTATVVGSGNIEVDTVDKGHFGNVYHNDIAHSNAVRTNYLQLPDIMDTVIDAGNKEMTIGFWVNKADEDNFFFSPIFSMYKEKAAENSWPMFILQTRLLAQINCAGFCDFGDSASEATENGAPNVRDDKGTNLADTTWLDDGKWHYYTATITTTNLKVYVDGEIKNSWTVNNTEKQQLEGLFSEYAKTDLNYICLGGNQAWNWTDADASFTYDDVAIYTSALTQGQIKEIIQEKNMSVYVQTKKQDNDKYTIRVVTEVALDGTFSENVNSSYVGAGFRCAKQLANISSAEAYLSTVVFKSIQANGKEVVAADGKYFVVTEITDIGAEDTVYVKPTYKTSENKAGDFCSKAYTVNMADILAQQ